MSSDTATSTSTLRATRITNRVARLLVVLLVTLGCTSGQQISNDLQQQEQQQQLDILSPPTPASPIAPGERQFRVVYEWNVLDFAFATEDERSRALFSGRYIPKNVLISDCKPHTNRLYLTIPRMLPGVPATLGYVVRPENNGRTDPEIVPYPSWEMNERGNCSALQFVQGIAVDKHGIMWVVDSGRTETLSRGSDHVVCPPKLLLLDLKRNGSVVLRYQFPESVVPPGNNYLNKVVVDDAYGGFAYITDNSGADPGIVVFSRRLLRSWKVRENNSMRAARNSVRFAVNGTELNFSIHIDSIALGPYYNPNLESDGGHDPLLGSQNYERNVYYCPLSSHHIYSLPASLLRDPEFNARATPRDILEAVTDYGEKSSQTDGMIMDNQGVLYYGLLGEHAIARWDTYRPFTPKNQQIVARDPTYIQWVDSMGFDHEGYLYVTINRLHNFVAGRLNPLEVNFRILRAKTAGLSYVETPDNLFNSDAKYLYGTDGTGETFVDNVLRFQYEGTTPASSRLAAAGILGSAGRSTSAAGPSAVGSVALLLVLVASTIGLHVGGWRA
uniref:Putative major royal jelly protein n=2 Tax=Anopheles marajoara TaxID=58244 RepID=A0A2M4BJ17_9DIPT